MTWDIIEGKWTDTGTFKSVLIAKQMLSFINNTFSMDVE
jgi:hypothetical protein